MPNDCWNKLTFVCESDPVQLKELYNKEFVDKHIPHDRLTMHYMGEKGIRLSKWSGWGPDNEWLLGLIEKYPKCWIKNDWYEEGGGAGIFVGGYLNDKQHDIIIEEWDELCIEGVYFILGGSQ
jgi:hypothetical protein